MPSRTAVDTTDRHAPWASSTALRNSPLRLRLAEGELTVSAQTQDVGETQESMPAAYTGEEFMIGFNAEFLRDGVDSIVGDDVVKKVVNVGDIIIIPAGTPHGWADIPDHVDYLSVRPDPQRTIPELYTNPAIKKQ